MSLTEYQSEVYSLVQTMVDRLPDLEDSVLRSNIKSVLATLKPAFLDDEKSINENLEAIYAHISYQKEISQARGRAIIGYEHSPWFKNYRAENRKMPFWEFVF
jgi:hypothetical protein